MSGNENPTCQNLWGAEKTVLREKFVAVSSCITKERYQINNLSVYFKEL